MTHPFLKTPARLTRLALIAVAFWLAAGSAYAHPGHRLHEVTPAHLFTSPYHLALFALSAAAIWSSGRWVRRRLPRHLLRGLGLAILATAIMLAV